MRYLSDSEILSWNNRLKEKWRLLPRYTPKSSNPVIVIKEVTSMGMGMETFRECEDPTIVFNFIFSISKNRDVDFFKMFEQLLAEGFDTNFEYNNHHQKINIDRSVILSTEKQDHRIHEKEYIRYNYSLLGKITQIVALVTIIEDTIKFADMMWGYSESGEEVSLLSFPVGTVVSPKNNKSLDYIVLDYHFVRDWSGFRIELKTSQMNFNEKSSVIQYGELKTFKEEELQFSRNSRIDQILN